MPETRRTLLQLTAAAMAWRPGAVWWRGPADRPRSIARIAAAAVSEGHAAGVAVGHRLPIKPPCTLGYGKANLETGAPVNGDTVFRIASCTKQFTAAAILLLAERGKLKVEDRLSAFFSEFPCGDEVTLHQLLTHTSGVHDYVFGGLPDESGPDWQSLADRHRILARMKPLYDFDPGTHWAYSNSGYALLGEIVERVSNKSWIDFVTDNLLRPAGMISTVLEDPARIVRHRATGYSPDIGGPGRFRNAPFGGVPIAEGGLCSTAGDLLRWNRALYSGRLLSEASLRRMTTAAATTDGTPIGNARFGQDGERPPFVTQADYGYGLEISRMFDHRVFWHSGGINGFNAIMLHFPDDRADLILLANTDNGAVPIFEPMLRALLPV
jgi:CubicO group peptidase (beta-lactamase class C family)